MIILMLVYDYINVGVWLYWCWCMIILLLVYDYIDVSVWLYWCWCMIILMLVYDYTNAGVWLYWCWCMIILMLVYDYIDVAIWLYWGYAILKLYIYFLFTLFYKTFLTLQFNRRNIFILRRCRILCAACGTVWSGFGEGVFSRWLCGVCVCVCVCRHHLSCCKRI